MSAKKPQGQKFVRVVVYAPPRLAKWILSTCKGKTISARVVELLEWASGGE